MDKRIKERERERRNANFCAENYLGFGKFSLLFKICRLSGIFEERKS
jgi:hypothetical protein